MRNALFDLNLALSEPKCHWNSENEFDLNCDIFWPNSILIQIRPEFKIWHFEMLSKSEMANNGFPVVIDWLTQKVYGYMKHLLPMLRILAMNCELRLYKSVYFLKVR